MLGLAAMSSAGLAQTLEGSVLEGPMLGGPALEVGAANAAGMSELRLGLRGVRVPAGSLGTGTLDARVGTRGVELHYRQALTLPPLGYAEAGAEAQTLWSGGGRAAGYGVVAAGSAELRLAGETFTAPLLLLRPLDTLDDPTPDPRAAGGSALVQGQVRVGPGASLRLGREWGAWAGSTIEAELRPQLWQLESGPAVLALVSPADADPDLWADSRGTLTLRLGSEKRVRTGAGLRLGAAWADDRQSAELGAVLGGHQELTARWQGYDLLGPDSQVNLGLALSDAWAADGQSLGLQWQAGALVPLGGGQLSVRGSTGAAGSGARVVYILPISKK